MSLIMQNIHEKTKMDDTKQKACYWSNFKYWIYLSKQINKQEISHSHPENLELLALKEMKLVAFL